MELKITLISLLVLLSVIIAETEAARHRKIIIHVPVKTKQQKHTHTLLKPVHVHHKQTIIKEEKTVKQEIHKPVHHTKEIIHKPVEIHHEVIKVPEIKEHRPIYKEEISHEHLHHHYKHVHPDISEQHHEFNDINGGHGHSYNFETQHP